MSNLSICVVGAGVAGLSTAHVLHEQYASAQLTIVSDAPFEQTTSYGPAGMFRPYIDEYMYVSGGMCVCTRATQRLEPHYPASIRTNLCTVFAGRKWTEFVQWSHSRR
jgi:glycine/D-amino acid oxidase-like deaminating enzyme